MTDNALFKFIVLNWCPSNLTQEMMVCLFNKYGYIVERVGIIEWIRSFNVFDNLIRAEKFSDITLHGATPTDLKMCKSFFVAAQRIKKLNAKKPND